MSSMTVRFCRRIEYTSHREFREGGKLFVLLNSVNVDTADFKVAQLRPFSSEIGGEGEISFNPHPWSA
jgi:hypothetical protein